MNNFMQSQIEEHQENQAEILRLKAENSTLSAEIKDIVDKGVGEYDMALPQRYAALVKNDMDIAERQMKVARFYLIQMIEAADSKPHSQDVDEQVRLCTLALSRYIDEMKRYMSNLEKSSDKVKMVEFAHGNVDTTTSEWVSFYSDLKFYDDEYVRAEQFISTKYQQVFDLLENNPNAKLDADSNIMRTPTIEEAKEQKIQEINKLRDEAGAREQVTEAINRDNRRELERYGEDNNESVTYRRLRVLNELVPGEEGIIKQRSSYVDKCRYSLKLQADALVSQDSADGRRVYEEIEKISYPVEHKVDELFAGLNQKLKGLSDRTGAYSDFKNWEEWQRKEEIMQEYEEKYSQVLAQIDATNEELNKIRQERQQKTKQQRQPEEGA